MAVPKRHHSKARRDSVNSVWKLEAPALVKCSNCGAHEAPTRHVATAATTRARKSSRRPDFLATMATEGEGECLPFLLSVSAFIKGGVRVAVKIEKVDANPAAALGFAPGDELLEVDGEPINDMLDISFYTDSPKFHLTARIGGTERTLAVEKDAYAPFGCDF